MATTSQKNQGLKPAAYNRHLHIMLLTIILSFCSTFAAAEAIQRSGAQLEAEKLLGTMNMSRTMDQLVTNMIGLQIQQNPDMAPYRSVLLDFFGKHMNFESLQDDLIRIYVEAYSEEELKEINTFYASNVGQKTIRLMPELIAKRSQVGQQRVQDNIWELEQMIQEKSERILETQHEHEHEQK